VEITAGPFGADWIETDLRKMRIAVFSPVGARIRMPIQGPREATNGIMWDLAVCRFQVRILILA